MASFPQERDDHDRLANAHKVKENQLLGFVSIC